MPEVAGCGDASPSYLVQALLAKWNLCVTCLQVNVNKDTVVVLERRNYFCLWESREVVISMTPRSYADLHFFFCTMEQ